MRERKERLDPAYLGTTQQERDIHRQLLLNAAIELTDHTLREQSMGPEPRFTIYN